MAESPRFKFVEFDAIPWQSIKDNVITMMLKRFINEHSIDNYKVYIGDIKNGHTYPV